MNISDISTEVLKNHDLTKIDRIEGLGFLIATVSGSSLYLSDDLLAILFRASDLDPSDFV